MIVRFFDRADDSNPLNGLAIQERRQLIEVFQGLQNRKPLFCEFFGGNGYKLLVGVAGAIGCAQYSSIDGSPPYLMAMPRNGKLEEGYQEFLLADTPTPVPKRYCMQLEAIIEIVEFFRQTGKVSPEVSWEEI
jgi:immunity protein Imm1 of predicted polymorphic toxin system